MTVSVSEKSISSQISSLTKTTCKVGNFQDLENSPLSYYIMHRKGKYKEAIHRIWAVLECIRRHGKYDEKHMLEIEREEEEDENEED